MTQKTIEFFLDEIWSKPPKEIYPTNKTDFYHFDDFWSSDVSDLKENDPEKDKGVKNDLEVINNFSKFGWTVPLENISAQTKKDSFESFLITSVRKLILVESDRDKRLFDSCFQTFLNINNTEHYSRN